MVSALSWKVFRNIHQIIANAVQIDVGLGLLDANGRRCVAIKNVNHELLTNGSGCKKTICSDRLPLLHLNVVFFLKHVDHIHQAATPARF